MFIFYYVVFHLYYAKVIIGLHLNVFLSDQKKISKWWFKLSELRCQEKSVFSEKESWFIFTISDQYILYILLFLINMLS